MLQHQQPRHSRARRGRATTRRPAEAERRSMVRAVWERQCAPGAAEGGDGGLQRNIYRRSRRRWCVRLPIVSEVIASTHAHIFGE